MSPSTSTISVFFYTPNGVYLIWGLVTCVQFCLLLPIVFRIPRTPLARFRFKPGVNISGKTRITFSRANQQLVLWYSVVMGMLVNLFTLTCVYWMHGGVVLAPLGFRWSVTLASVLLTLVFNLFLVWYITLPAWRPAQRACGVMHFSPSAVSCADEYLFLFLLHLLSLVIFGFCDLGTLFIGVEVVGFIFILITGVPAVGVVSAKPSMRGGANTLAARVSEAALTYLWTGLLSALPFLAGIILIYYDTGTLAFDDLLPLLVWDGALSLDFLGVGPHMFARWGSFLILISLLFKLGVAPLHGWLVRVYAGAQGHTVYLLATVSKFFYMAILIRFVLPLLPMGGSQPSLFFIVIGLCSVTVGCYWGLQELRFTNLLAYSGILNIGLSLLALGLPQTFLGPFIALLLLWTYLFLLMFFLSLTAWAGSRSSDGLLHDRIAFRVFNSFSPLLRLLLAVVIFGLVGLPPILGFFPKLILLVAYILNLSPVLGLWFMGVVVVSSFMYLRLAAGVLVSLFTPFSWSTFMYGLVYDIFTWRIAWVVGAIIILLVYPGTALAFIALLVVCVLDPRTGGTTGSFDDMGHYIDIEKFVTAALSCDLLSSGGGGIF